MKQNFLIVYILLLVVQILIGNFFNFSVYLTLSLLPVIVFFLPTGMSAFLAMIIAFASGLAVDFLADGVLGLNAFALVPVAYLRRPLSKVIFGEDLLSRNGTVSVAKYGLGKVIFALLIVQTVFLFFYLIADGAPVHTFSFNLLRFAVSLAGGLILNLPVMGILSSDDR